MDRLLCAWLILGGLLAPSLSGAAKHPVETVFHFSGQVARRLSDPAVKDSLRLQVLALNLDQRQVQYHGVFSLKPEAQVPAAPGAMRHRNRLMLPPGQYLLEYLLFDPGTDRFGLWVRRVDTEPSPVPVNTPAQFTLDDLPRTEFDQYSRSLLYHSGRPSELEHNCLLWRSVEDLSLRPSGMWDDLYRRLKLECAYVNYSAAAREAMRYRYGRLRLPYAVLPSVYRIAIRADNLAWLGERLAEASGDTGQLLDRLHDEAGGLNSCCMYLCMDRIVTDDYDEGAFVDDFAARSPAERIRGLQELTRAVSAETRRMFFQRPTISVEALSRDSLLVLVRKIRSATHAMER
jgi:hypothetical protein